MKRGILWQMSSTMAGTWIGHGCVCLILLTGFALLGRGLQLAQEGAVVGAAFGLAYYLVREASDKARKIREGAYTEESRLDRVGDLACPAFVFAAAVLVWVAGMV